jgi:hypothetical protein
VLSQQLWEVLPKGHAALFHLDQHLAWDQGISEPHASASPTLGNLVLKAHTGFCGIRPAPGTEQLLNEGLALLLLVAAAAGDPLGEGVERLLICHGWAFARRFSPPPEGCRRHLPILN